MKRYYRSDENSWEELAKRVSTAVADAEETAEDKNYMEGVFYDMISNLDFIPSTPCLINANKENPGQLSSCFIISVKDNIESIYEAKTESAKIFQRNGGY